MKLEIEVFAKCEVCGSDLTSHIVMTRINAIKLNVKPCEVCIENNINEALEEIEPA